MNIPLKYEDVVAQLEAANELACRCIDSADRNHLRAVNSEQREAALREELDERTRKHLRSCQLAIGKSQLAKELRQRLTFAEQRWLQVEGACDLAISAIDDDERGANFVKIIQAIKEKAALKPAEEDDSDLQKIGFVRMNTKTDQPRISLADMHARYDRKPCQEPQAHPTRCGCEDLSHDQ